MDQNLPLELLNIVLKTQREPNYDHVRRRLEHHVPRQVLPVAAGEAVLVNVWRPIVAVAVVVTFGIPLDTAAGVIGEGAVVDGCYDLFSATVRVGQFPRMGCDLRIRAESALRIAKYYL